MSDENAYKHEWKDNQILVWDNLKMNHRRFSFEGERMLWRNTVLDIAVISVPRTASKSLTDYYSKETGKSAAVGILHKPEFLKPTVEYNVRKTVYEKQHVLHGHWHTLPLLDNDIKFFLRTYYKIVTSHRPEKLVRQSIERITGRDDIFDEMIKKSLEEMRHWNIHQRYIIDGDEIIPVDECPEGYV